MMKMYLADDGALLFFVFSFLRGSVIWIKRLINNMQNTALSFPSVK